MKWSPDEGSPDEGMFDESSEGVPDEEIGDWSISHATELRDNIKIEPTYNKSYSSNSSASLIL